MVVVTEVGNFIDNSEVIVLTRNNSIVIVIVFIVCRIVVIIVNKQNLGIIKLMHEVKIKVVAKSIGSFEVVVCISFIKD